LFHCGDKLPAGSRVPKASVTCIAYSKHAVVFIKILSNKPILVGVKGFSLRPILDIPFL
jgi:hypothetical protein